MTIRTLIDLSQVPRLVAISMAMSLSFANVVAADGQSQWNVTLVEGPVQVRTGEDDWSFVRQGQVLPAGSHVMTGAEGRLILSHGGDEIAAGAGADFTVSAGTSEGPYSVMQSMGRMLFRMESRATRDFRVGTPYLAAAIKGTTFVVDVEASGASVSVEEGTVEVTIAATAEILMVDAGGTVTASANGPEAPASLDKRPVDNPGEQRDSAQSDAANAPGIGARSDAAVGGQNAGPDRGQNNKGDAADGTPGVGQRH